MCWKWKLKQITVKIDSDSSIALAFDIGEEPTRKRFEIL